VECVQKEDAKSVGADVPEINRRKWKRKVEGEDVKSPAAVKKKWPIH